MPTKAFADFKRSPQADAMNRRPWWVYVVELFSVRGFYTGIALDPSIRLQEHISGMGAIVTERFGVLRLHHLERHAGFQLAQFRENVVSRYYLGLGALSFGGAGRLKIPAEEVLAPHLRVIVCLSPMLLADVPRQLPFESPDGDLPLPPVPWAQPTVPIAVAVQPSQ